MYFHHTARSADLHAKAQAFFRAEILPRHREWEQIVCQEGKPAPFLKDLQAKAREQGLWNLALPALRDDEPGTHCNNLEFSAIAELLGRLPWASEVFNCHAPEVPNMVMLQELATPEQRKTWLNPLLNGQIRSSFGMTEPAVASSDATNISTRIVEDGDDFVLNGHKWFATGGGHPDCAFLIVMGISDPNGGRTGRHSMVIVPMDAAGLTVTRKLRYLGWTDHVAPIAEITLENVRVPQSNLLGQRGQGFKGAQLRLGPARIHHCMRCIGMAEMIVEQMMVRAQERSTFGRPIAEYDTVQKWIAEARIDIEQTRLFIQRAAATLDHANNKAAWHEISMIKVATPRMLQRIADNALQLFGAMGGTDDTLIHHSFTYARWLRIGDGPDEVHLRQIFRNEPTPQYSLHDSPYITSP